MLFSLGHVLAGESVASASKWAGEEFSRRTISGLSYYVTELQYNWDIHVQPLR